MKKLLLSVAVIVSMLSCTKDETYSTINTQEKTSLYSKSDDGHNDDDEGQCCSFRYGQWSTCSDGYQVRTWSSRGTGCTPPIDSIQRTCDVAVVQYFYFNTGYTGIRVVCNRPGSVHIYNSTGQLTSILNYNAPAAWLILTFLPAGTYTATTYNRTITFTVQ